MSVTQLAGRFEAVFGEPCRSRHKQYLVRRIAWRLQANAEGGLSERARKRAEELACDAEIRVLLSFAQFERDIIGERIRDKIAAQRRKGKWTGGVPVLGYDVDRSTVNPKLVVNAEEAVVVRRIFSLYLELGSLLPVSEELARRGWRGKSWKTKKGVVRGGRPFDRNSVYELLTNPIYVGKIRHKSELHAGEHPPLIDAKVFDRVQATLREHGGGRGHHLMNKYGALLRGLLHCGACGQAMVHTFSVRGSKRYRYYKCGKALKSGRTACPSKTLPAPEIEAAVVDQLRGIARDVELREEVVCQARESSSMELAEAAGERRQLETQIVRDQNARRPRVLGRRFDAIGK
jgi:site-specific DNA recombinase